MARPWNLNIHYDSLLDSRVPPGARRILDVGTGDGFLAARLARRTAIVVALDVDAAVLQRARARFPGAQVDWVHDDVMDADFAAGSFDAVVSNSTLHHLEHTEAALRRLASWLAPGGVLAVVTFVRSEPRDLPWQALAWVCRGIVLRVRGKWQHSAPTVWPPRDTLADLRRHAQKSLPGARVRRLLHGRVLLTWNAPEL